MALTFISSSISTDNACIGSDNVLELVVQNGSSSIANTEDYELWLSNAWFVDAGFPLPAEPTSATGPFAPAHYYKVLGTETPATEYDMQLTGFNLGANQVIEKATVALSVASSQVRFTFRVYFWNVSDLLNYPILQWDNRNKLLRTRNDGTTDLVNSAISIYNSNKAIRSFVIQKSDTGTVSTLKQDIAYTARWWASDNLGAAQTVVTNPEFALEVNGNVATKLSPYDDTIVEFTGTGTYTIEWFGAIRTTSPDQTVTHIQSYQNNVAQLPGGNGAPATAQAFSDFPANLEPTTVGDSGTIWQTGNTAGTDYISVNPAALTPGQLWRFYVVIEDASNKRYAFISDEYQVPFPGSDEGASLPEICPPDIDSHISNYQQTFPARCLQVAPMQRLESQITICEGSYCNEIALLDGLKRVDLRAYYEAPRAQGGNWQHNVLQASVQKRNIPLVDGTQWEGVNGMTLDDSGACYVVALPFRLRYEPDVPNISSISDTTPAIIAAQPLGNQDWTGKTIWLEWTLQANAQTASGFSYTNIIVYRQKLEVQDYDTTIISFEAQDDSGNPITQLCEGDALCVEVTKSDAGDQNLLWLLDGKPYRASTVREGESWEGVLPQLDAFPVSGVLPSAFSSNTALACINTNALETGRKYRLSVVKYSATACNETFAIIGAGDVFQYQGPVGAQPFIIAYDFYGGADAMRVTEAGSGTVLANIIDFGGAGEKLINYFGIVVETSTEEIVRIQTKDSGYIYKLFCNDYIPQDYDTDIELELSPSLTNTTPPLRAGSDFQAELIEAGPSSAGTDVQITFTPADANLQYVASAVAVSLGTASVSWGHRANAGTIPANAAVLDTSGAGCGGTITPDSTGAFSQDDNSIKANYPNNDLMGVTPGSSSNLGVCTNGVNNGENTNTGTQTITLNNVPDNDVICIMISERGGGYTPAPASKAFTVRTLRV